MTFGAKRKKTKLLISIFSFDKMRSNFPKRQVFRCNIWRYALH